MSGIANSTGAKSGIIGTTVGTPAAVSSYNIRYLLLGGGAGGGSNYTGGGGGAGGYKAGNFTAATSMFSSITLTIGPGGTGSTDGANDEHGYNGGDSKITATATADSGFSPILVNGGGAGSGGSKVAPRCNGVAGANGGGAGGWSYSTTSEISGGNKSFLNSSQTGIIGVNTVDLKIPSTPNQGNTGGTGCANTPGNERGGGGGGGAGGPGANGENKSSGSYGEGGSGGIGLASDITGSSVLYAGGGGGGGGGGASAAGGTGTGGGGSGGTDSNDGVDGADAKGGGGGGSGADGISYDGGDGGNGVAILRMLTANYSGTITGSPTVDPDGLFTVLTFTGTGTYTI